MKDTSNKLLAVCSLVLAVAGLALILVSVFFESESGWALRAGLGCIALGNLYTIVRQLWRKKP